MPNFAENRIISTAGGDANQDYYWDFGKRGSGSFKCSIAGVFGSRTLAVQDVDRSGNKTVLKDPDGNLMSAVAANVAVVAHGKGLLLTMSGTGTAEITLEALQL